MMASLLSPLKGHLKRRLGVPEVSSAMERLSAQGFTPQRVFDVGAHVGDYARICRDVWPHVTIVGFEPRQQAAAVFRSQMDENMTLYEALLGPKVRESVVLHEADTASSVLDEQVGQGHPGVLHPMLTVDTVVASDFSGRGPDLLKLDVQGYELEVLKGAEDTLGSVEVILAEVNLLDIHIGVPLLAELSSWLVERGFVAFDICGLTRRPLDDVLWQADMLFVCEDSFLMRDKRWSA